MDIKIQFAGFQNQCRYSKYRTPEGIDLLYTSLFQNTRGTGEELNYIETMIHLEEQYRITPTGERALIEHEREIQREKRNIPISNYNFDRCHCLD